MVETTAPEYSIYSPRAALFVHRRRGNLPETERVSLAQLTSSEYD